MINEKTIHINDISHISYGIDIFDDTSLSIHISSSSSLEGAKEYIKNFRKSKTRKSAIRYGVFFMLIMLLTAFITENVVIGALGLLVGVVFLNMHNIVLHTTKRQIQSEVDEAFPQWLFDMCLLSQKDNISVAISESIETAPPILKKELMAMEEILRYEPKSKKAFLGFLQEYEMPGVKKTMEILYSLHIGYAIGQTEQMQKLIDRNVLLIKFLTFYPSRRQSLFHGK